VLESFDAVKKDSTTVSLSNLVRMIRECGVEQNKTRSKENLQGMVKAINFEKGENSSSELSYTGF